MSLDILEESVKQDSATKMAEQQPENSKETVEVPSKPPIYSHRRMLEEMLKQRYITIK